jgi:hypothetical protein
MSDLPKLPLGWDYYNYEMHLGRDDGVRLNAPHDMSLCLQVIEDFETCESLLPSMQSKPTIADNPDDPVWMSQDGVMQINNACEARKISWSVTDDPISWDGEREPVNAERYTIAPERIVELQKNDPSLTPERLTAGVAAMLDYDGDDDAGEIAAVWKAMSTSAPVSLLSDARNLIAWLEVECKRLADGPPTQHPPEFVAKVLMDREGRHDPMAHGRLTEVIRCARLDGRKQARDELAAAESPGDHDYHGPTETVPHPDIPDRTVQRAISNPTHEQFHRSIGDVLAGKIIPAARRQMEDALGRAPKDEPTTASTSRPMPEKALGVAGQAIGVRLP